MLKPATIVWFRQDLRLEDNPALAAAAGRGGPVIPAYIWSPKEEGRWPPGAAARWWLHHSLTSLGRDLAARRSALIVRQGDTAAQLAELVRESGAGAVFWNRRYEPAIRERDADLERTLRASGLTVGSFNAALLFEPWDAQTQTGRPFQVFTAYWNACRNHTAPAAPAAAPELTAPAQWPKSIPLAKLKLEPNIDWAAGFRREWRPGERGGRERLDRFAGEGLKEHQAARDRPDHDGVSGLSPHLHFGEIGPRQVWQAVLARMGRARNPQSRRSAEGFLRQLIWREFAHHLLYHFPHTPDRPLRDKFERFPWIDDPDGFEAWRRGRTGYPIVDAGMRALWSTGWMHNRARMIVASFLVKDLLVPWQEGARWFWDTLVDADLANNTMGWQWTTGCGADAAPYFRVFNPVLQGEKFDPSGDYVRRWVPELARLPAAWIHKPWRAPSAVLNEAGVAVGGNYPAPIVDHAEARRRALAALAALRSRG